MAKPREPQSYGSQDDWSSGRTGQAVNDPKAAPPARHADFYDSRHDDDVQGGETSVLQSEPEHAPAPYCSVSDPAKNVTAQRQGAKRGGYFKDRDYE